MAVTKPAKTFTCPFSAASLSPCAIGRPAGTVHALIRTARLAPENDMSRQAPGWPLAGGDRTGRRAHARVGHDCEALDAGRGRGKGRSRRVAFQRART